LKHDPVIAVDVSATAAAITDFAIAGKSSRLNG
jgi:hypothetical protein